MHIQRTNMDGGSKLVPKRHTANRPPYVGGLGLRRRAGCRVGCDGQFGARFVNDRVERPGAGFSIFNAGRAAGARAPGVFEEVLSLCGRSSCKVRKLDLAVGYSDAEFCPTDVR